MDIIFGGHYSAYPGDSIQDLEMGRLPWMTQVDPMGSPGSLQEGGKKVKSRGRRWADGRSK